MSATDETLPCGVLPASEQEAAEHLRTEHRDCPHCGAEAREPYCVRHELDCPRLAEKAY